MSTPAAVLTKPVKPVKTVSHGNFREYGLMIALVAIMVFFQIMTSGTLFKPLNLTNLVLQNSYVIIMALGMLLVIVAGYIDLSVGSVAGFIGALASVMMVRFGIDFRLAMFLCLIVGGAIGAAQGYWIAYHKIPSFIVTLAGMLVFRGLTLALLGGNSIGPFVVPFQQLSSGFIPDLPGQTGFRITSMAIGTLVAVVMFYNSLRRRLNREKHGFQGGSFFLFVLENLIISGLVLYLSYQLSSYKGLPNVLIIMGVLIALFAFITTRTTVGRRIYALGGNEKAAKLSGIKTERLAFGTFITMGVLAALAGLVFTARLNTATPKAGVGFELDVIAAVFIGGASASGGVGKVMGAVIGAFIMGVMNNGMSIMGVGIDWQQVVKGLVLLAAVIFDVYNKNKA
ncbi:MAG: putative multiple sugar transport system permease protein [Verrucomicrobiota bacterium]|jgi:putative multiple sugar transport system permease protein|nr:putative multiple sugar transport system permease protein [Verrucomicrobiota bacterium]